MKSHQIWMSLLLYWILTLVSSTLVPSQMAQHLKTTAPTSPCRHYTTQYPTRTSHPPSQKTSSVPLPMKNDTDTYRPSLRPIIVIPILTPILNPSSANPYPNFPHLELGNPHEQRASPLLTPNAVTTVACPETNPCLRTWNSANTGVIYLPIDKRK